MCLSFNMGWRILVNFIRQPVLKLKTHSGFHDLFLKNKLYIMAKINHLHTASNTDFILICILSAVSDVIAQNIVQNLVLRFYSTKWERWPCNDKHSLFEKLVLFIFIIF
jgi:hypothetical protein